MTGSSLFGNTVRLNLELGLTPAKSPNNLTTTILWMPMCKLFEVLTVKELAFVSNCSQSKSSIFVRHEQVKSI